MKKFLLSLFVGLFGFLTFGYCDNSYLVEDKDCISHVPVSVEGSCLVPADFSTLNCDSGKLRLYIGSYGNFVTLTCPFSYTPSDLSGYGSDFTYNPSSGVYVRLVSDFTGCSYTSEQCQSEYGLVSSGLLTECQSSLSSCQLSTSGFNDQLNNCNLSLNACNSSLTSCLQYNCPEVDYTGDLLWSNIYINNILHPGRQFVNISIPDYISWDYSVGDDDFDLYVGTGYDVDYIDSIVSINSYRPTSEDFTNVFVGGLTLVMPYVVILLFIIFVWKLIKRIFK